MKLLMEKLFGPFMAPDGESSGEGQDVPDLEEDVEGEGSGEDADPEQAGKPNEKFKRMREKAEAEARIKAQKVIDDKIAAFGWTNPYKENSAINTEADLEEYNQQHARAQKATKAGINVEDLEVREYVHEQKKALEDKKNKEAYARRDLDKFAQEYPDVDPSKLWNNAKFMKFSKGKVGAMPLSEIYEDFTELISETEQSAFNRARSRQDRNSGSGNGGAATSLTPAQDKALREWNERFPDKRMTPKEYLAR